MATLKTLDQFRTEVKDGAFIQDTTNPPVEVWFNPGWEVRMNEYADVYLFSCDPTLNTSYSEPVQMGNDKGSYTFKGFYTFDELLADIPNASKEVWTIVDNTSREPAEHGTAEKQ